MVNIWCLLLAVVDSAHNGEASAVKESNIVDRFLVQLESRIETLLSFPLIDIDQLTNFNEAILNATAAEWPVSEFIEEYLIYDTLMRKWRQAIRTMQVAEHNAPVKLHDSYLRFTHDEIERYNLISTLNGHDSLRDGWHPPSAAVSTTPEPTEFAPIVAPRRVTLIEAGTRTISAFKQSFTAGTWSLYAHRISLIVQLSIMPGLPLGEKGKFCELIADALIRIVGHFSVDGDWLSVIEIESLLEMARMCLADLKQRTRRDVIPALLIPIADPDDDVPESAKISFNQSAGYRERLETLSRYSKLDFISGDFEINTIDAVTTGSGPKIVFAVNTLREAFDPANSMFIFTDEREVYLKPNMEGVSVGLYRQVGRLIAMAIQEDVPIGISFSPAVLEYLHDPFMAPKWTDSFVFELLASENPGKAAGLKKLKTTTPEELSLLDLEPGDVESFITATARNDVIDSIAPAMRELVRGIYDVLPVFSLSWMNTTDLAVMLEGSEVVNRTDLVRSTAIASELTDEDETSVLWLQELLASDFSEEEIVRFIEFVSGSPRAPVFGFSGYTGDRKWLKISIDPAMAVDSLPRAQLCFTQIILPIYSSKAVMHSRIACAINHCTTLDNH